MLDKTCCRHSAFYKFGYIEESYLVFKERTYSHLVSGIYDTWHVTALPECLTGEFKTWEALGVGREEGESLLQAEQVEARVVV